MIDNITMEEVLVCLGIETVRAMRLETALEMSRNQNKQLSGQVVGADKIRDVREKPKNPRKKETPKRKTRGVKNPTTGPAQMPPPSMQDPVNTGDLPG